jgi:hypothetical protein
MALNQSFPTTIVGLGVASLLVVLLLLATAVVLLRSHHRRQARSAPDGTSRR